MKRPPRQDIEQLYLVQKLSYKEIGARYGVSAGCVSQWIIRFGIANRQRKIAYKPTADELRRLYHDEAKTTTEIGVLYHCTGKLVLKWMAKCGIPTRERIAPPPYEQLYHWYIIEKRGAPEIARLLHCSHPSIFNWLRSYNIPIRTNSEAQILAHHTEALTNEVLQNLYIDEKLSQKTIAQRFGLTQSAVGYRMRRYGIPTRGKANNGTKNGMHGRTHTSEAREKMRKANARQFSDPKVREAHALLTAKQIQSGRTGKSYNKLEQRVAKILDASGIVYEQQYRLGRFLFDFYLPATHTLLEVHGTFWHADPRIYSHDRLSRIQQRNVANDLKKAAYATTHGYRLQVLWEADVS
jgi:G:T-mismatch repair DNA endonuclease (very short patch repair protein)/predicted DNA-binding protein YlxM (UPF0122 family)